MSINIEIEKIFVHEKENLLNHIISNIQERQHTLGDLELFLDSLINMMKNDILFGGERHCYQWMYARKTKEIVDKVKVLNLNLRTIQKEAGCLLQTKDYIDQVLNLEKLNFDNIINIFNKKMNFLKFFETGILEINNIESEPELEVDSSYEQKVYIETLEKELAELISIQIETKKKLQDIFIRIHPCNL